MRIAERQLLLPTLQIASSRPGGEIKTGELIAQLESFFHPWGDDAKVLRNRTDTRFSQKVRNLISHKMNRTSMFRRGLAVTIDGGLRITEVGRQFLRDEGH